MKFDIYLNPKKSIFMVNQGNFFSHIISNEDLVIDLDRVKAIETLPLPSNKKIIQSFLGQVNFVRKFINDFLKIVSSIITMLKKDAQFSWSIETKQDFHDIKKFITKALVLKNPNFSKDFIMYVYGLDKSIINILSQKNDQEEEHLIVFHSQTLHIIR